MRKLLILGWSLAFLSGVMLFVTHMTKCTCSFEDRYKAATPKGTNVIRVIPITRDAEHVPVPQPLVEPPAAVLPSVIDTTPVPVPAEGAGRSQPERMAKIRVAPPKPRDVCERHGLKKTYTNNKRRWRCR